MEKNKQDNFICQFNNQVYVFSKHLCHNDNYDIYDNNLKTISLRKEQLIFIHIPYEQFCNKLKAEQVFNQTKLFDIINTMAKNQQARKLSQEQTIISAIDNANLELKKTIKTKKLYLNNLNSFLMMLNDLGYIYLYQIANVDVLKNLLFPQINFKKMSWKTIKQLLFRYWLIR